MSDSEHARGGPHDAEFPEIDELLRGANPNPDRRNCPPQERLIALARARGSISDPFYKHLLTCSDCYREWQELRRRGVGAGSAGASGDLQPVPGSRSASTVVSAEASRSSGAERGRPPRRWPWWAIAVAAAIVAAVGTLSWLPPQFHRSSVEDAGARSSLTGSVEARRAQLDLRPFRVERREVPEETKSQPLVLTSSRLELTIILPDFSEPGRYDVKVIDHELKAHSSVTGDAVIQNERTQLTVALDLQSVPVGPCQLAIRHSPGEWRMYPAVIKSPL